MNYLQAINSVLRRLREDEVATYNQSDYSSLIGDFVNETKREVEDAWNWTQLRTNIPVTTAASTRSYTLTGSGERHRILQVINDTQDTVMHKASYEWMNRTNDTGSSTESSPIYYNIAGSTSGDADVQVYPTPDAIETLNFYMVVPQNDLAADGTEITVPSWPIILGAYAKAVLERGEDGGTQFQAAALMYNSALSDAVAIDSGNAPSELNWTVR